MERFVSSTFLLRLLVVIFRRKRRKGPLTAVGLTCALGRCFLFSGRLRVMDVGGGGEDEEEGSFGSWMHRWALEVESLSSVEDAGRSVERAVTWMKKGVDGVDGIAQFTERNVADVVFVASLVIGGDRMVAAMAERTRTDPYIRAWSSGLHERFLKYLRAEDVGGVYGDGGRAVRAAVEMVSAPRIDAALGPMLSVLVPLAQDASNERRMEGLRALRYVVRESGSEALRWHAEALRGTLSMTLRYRDAHTCAEAILCGCETIRALEGSRFKRIKAENMDESVSLHAACLHTLEAMIESGDVEQRIAASIVIGPFVEMTGQRMMMHLKRFLPALLHLLETTSSMATARGDAKPFTDTADAMILLCRTIWPRIPTHFDTVLPSVLSCLLRVSFAHHNVRFAVTNAVTSMLITARRCGTVDVFDAALLTAETEIPELTPVVTAVSTACSHDIHQPSPHNPFGDFEELYFEG